MSTTEISREIEINAPPPTVWAVLADTASYPEWNPFIPGLSGELRPGAKLKVRIAPPGGRALTFRPTVVTAEPGRELRWLGHLLLPRLLDGEHSFHLEELPGGRTHFVQSEHFGGFLVPLVSRTLRRTELGFEQMNDALAQRAESRAAQST